MKFVHAKKKTKPAFLSPARGKRANRGHSRRLLLPYRQWRALYCRKQNGSFFWPGRVPLSFSLFSHSSVVPVRSCQTSARPVSNARADNDSVGHKRRLKMSLKTSLKTSETVCQRVIGQDGLTRAIDSPARFFISPVSRNDLARRSASRVLRLAGVSLSR